VEQSALEHREAHALRTGHPAPCPLMVKNGTCNGIDCADILGNFNHPVVCENKSHTNPATLDGCFMWHPVFAKREAKNTKRGTMGNVQRSSNPQTRPTQTQSKGPSKYHRNGGGNKGNRNNGNRGNKGNSSLGNNGNGNRGATLGASSIIINPASQRW
jgi:hypothetical protein